MKSESFLTLHRQQGELPRSRHRNVVRTLCVSWYSWMAVDWPEENKLLNKAIILVFVATKCILIAWLIFWCHMDYFIDVLTTFLALNVEVPFLSKEGQKALGFYQKYLCSEDERRSYGFETAWGWVIKDRILFLGWTNPLIWCNLNFRHNMVIF